MNEGSIHFQSKGRDYEVKDACDLMVCFQQARRQAAEETLLEIRKKNQDGEVEDWKSYKMEKHMLKIVEFYRTKEKLISLYAEAKKHNGELASLLEEENIELLKYHDGAEAAFEQMKMQQEGGEVSEG